MITPDTVSPVAPMLDELSTEDFLQVVGQRVRQQRARKSMSRKRLAEVSTVSERYLAQLESGQGNMSIALLRKVTSAIGISMGALMSEEVTETCIRKATTNVKDAATPVTGQAVNSVANQEEPCARTGLVQETTDSAGMNSQQGRDSHHASSSFPGNSSAESA